MHGYISSSLRETTCILNTIFSYMIRAWEGGASNKSDGDSTHTSYESMDFQRRFYNGAGKGMFPDSTWGDERMYAVPICNCHDSLNTKSQLKMLLHSECSSQITSMKTMSQEFWWILDITLHRAPRLFRPFLESVSLTFTTLKGRFHPAVWFLSVDNPELLSCFVSENHLIQVSNNSSNFIMGSWSFSWLTSPQLLTYLLSLHKSSNMCFHVSVSVVLIVALSAEIPRNMIGRNMIKALTSIEPPEKTWPYFPL